MAAEPRKAFELPVQPNRRNAMELSRSDICKAILIDGATGTVQSLEVATGPHGANSSRADESKPQDPRSSGTEITLSGPLAKEKTSINVKDEDTHDSYVYQIDCPVEQPYKRRLNCLGPDQAANFMDNMKREIECGRDPISVAINTTRTRVVNGQNLMDYEHEQFFRRKN